jgi:hypothetical protein
VQPIDPLVYGSVIWLLRPVRWLLGHVSIQTTERYLGCKQELRWAVNDRMGIEPDDSESP